MDRKSAEALLQTAADDLEADFRPGQWEAIDALVNHRQKLMVIQRTGWGKSSVYFISTRILRDRGAGPTIIVSPLLALMRNQIEAAERLGIRAVSINSTNRDDWGRATQKVLADQVDAILISPERLSQVCLRPRDRFWDIPVPKIDSAFDNLLVPQPSWSPSTTQQL
ncbi:DEAD/DEAH box helicase, partial [Thiolapillus sp.]|uniref:DEAD/DEAH box helicase n=1 Tax=Thiolapillus sp. TaxID=2017437 RepID=UPI003AF743D3